MARNCYVDEEECIGCESCVGLCPAVFAMDEGTGKAKVTDPAGASEEDIQEAMDTCPVQCIHWEK